MFFRQAKDYLLRGKKIRRQEGGVVYKYNVNKNCLVEVLETGDEELITGDMNMILDVSASDWEVVEDD